MLRLDVKPFLFTCDRFLYQSSHPPKMIVRKTYPARSQICSVNLALERNSI